MIKARIKKILLFALPLLLIFALINRTGQPTAPAPSPTPVLLPPEEFIASPSAYATDEVVLKIEKDLEILEKDLETVDLEEPRLHPPVLDLNVEY